MAVLLFEAAFFFLAIFMTKFRAVTGSALVGITRHVENGMFPSVAVLKEKLDDKDILCSGALITYNHVLTAASCIADHEEKRITFLGYVIAGTLIRTGCSEYCQFRRVKDITVHKGFFDSSDDPDNVGVIRVHKSFDASKTVRPMPAAVSKVQIGSAVYIVGFYSIKNEQEIASDSLQYGEATILPLHFCEKENQDLKYLCTNMRTGGLGAPVYQGPSVIGVVVSVNGSSIEVSRLTANAVFYRGFIDKFVHSGKYMKLRNKKKTRSIAVMKSKMQIVLVASVSLIMPVFRGSDIC